MDHGPQLWKHALEVSALSRWIACVVQPLSAWPDARRRQRALRENNVSWLQGRWESAKSMGHYLQAGTAMLSMAKFPELGLKPTSKRSLRWHRLRCCHKEKVGERLEAN
eukprot:2079499-Amphidinium_carterae.3